MTHLRETIAELQKEAALIHQNINGITALKFEITAPYAEMDEVFNKPMFSELGCYYFDQLINESCSIVVRSTERYKTIVQEIITTGN